MNDDYDHIITELKAGMCINLHSKVDKAWNDACLRAINIVEKYKEGKGLFQLANDNDNK